MRPTLGRVVHVNIADSDSDKPTWTTGTVIQEAEEFEGGIRAPLIVRVMIPSGFRNEDGPGGRKIKSIGIGTRDFEIEPLSGGDGPGCWRWPPREG